MTLFRGLHFICLIFSENPNHMLELFVKTDEKQQVSDQNNLCFLNKIKNIVEINTSKFHHIQQFCLYFARLYA